MSKNKKWSPEAKFKIALQAIMGETTINDICTRYGVAPSQVHAWKKQLLEQGQELFAKTGKAKKQVQANQDRTERQLYEKIGQLTVERDFLKKAGASSKGATTTRRFN